MSKVIPEEEWKEIFKVLLKNSAELNELRVRRAVEEFDPENPLAAKEVDLEWIKKNLTYGS